MDKTTFFAALTNEAATPDAAFIEALRKKVVTTAAGAAPPSTGGGSILGNPGIIAGGIITTAIAGGVAFALFRDKPQQPPVQPVAAQITEDESSNDQPDGVLGESTTDPAEGTDLNDEDTAIPVVAETNTPQPSPQADAPVDEGNDDTVDTDPTLPVSNGLFTIDYWNLTAFKSAPTMPVGSPDLTLIGIESIDFDWGNQSPDATINSDYFAARATASKHFEPGNYKVNLTMDDGVRVFVDGVLIYDRWSAPDGTVEEAYFTVKDAANVYIVIEYFEQTANAIFKAIISENKKTASPPGEAVLIETSPFIQLLSE